MCLDTLLKPSDVKLGHEGEGYKVVYKKWDQIQGMSYTAPFAGGCFFGIGRTYTDYKDIMLRTEGDNSEYHTGYHIFKTLYGAKAYMELITFKSTYPAILKVRWANRVACGMQYGHVSLVVRTLTILEEVEGL